MAKAHAKLHGLLRVAAAKAKSKRVTWPQVLGLLEQICRERSPESEAVLREAARFEGSLALDPGPGLPHAMSPEDLLRCVAVQTLGRWDPKLHEDAILRAVALADHERVVSHARVYLP